MKDNHAAYNSCRLCPRNCGADRSAGERGFCGQASAMRIASAAVHRGEEPPLITGKGSGTVFFSGCTLGCPFCQNIQISSDGLGAEVPPGTLKSVCRALEAAGASNINLVTGTQFIPGIAAVLRELESEGFDLPVVWNSSGFESKAGIALIEPFVDVYLLDLKAVTAEGAMRLLGRRDYPEAAKGTARYAAGARPLLFRDGALVRGTIIRHLVMPGMEAETEKVIEWFGEHLTGRAIFSLMVQYLDPAGKTPRTTEPGYYKKLLDKLDRAGIKDGYIQEPGDTTDWTPDFTRWNPFPETYAGPVWHWKNKQNKEDVL